MFGKCSHCNQNRALRFSHVFHKVCVICVTPKTLIQVKRNCEKCKEEFQNYCNNCFLQFEERYLINNPAHPFHKLCTICLGILPEIQIENTCEVCLNLYSHHNSEIRVSLLPNSCILCKKINKNIFFRCDGHCICVLCIPIINLENYSIFEKIFNCPKCCQNVLLHIMKNTTLCIICKINIKDTKNKIIVPGCEFMHSVCNKCFQQNHEIDSLCKFCFNFYQKKKNADGCELCKDTTKDYVDLCKYKNHQICCDCLNLMVAENFDIYLDIFQCKECRGSLKRIKNNESDARLKSRITNNWENETRVNNEKCIKCRKNESNVKICEQHSYCKFCLMSSNDIKCGICISIIENRCRLCLNPNLAEFSLRIFIPGCSSEHFYCKNCIKNFYLCESNLECVYCQRYLTSKSKKIIIAYCNNCSKRKKSLFQTCFHIFCLECLRSDSQKSIFYSQQCEICFEMCKDSCNICFKIIENPQETVKISRISSTTFYCLDCLLSKTNENSEENAFPRIDMTKKGILCILCEKPPFQNENFACVDHILCKECYEDINSSNYKGYSAIISCKQCNIRIWSLKFPRNNLNSSTRPLTENKSLENPRLNYETLPNRFENSDPLANSLNYSTINQELNYSNLNLNNRIISNQSETNQFLYQINSFNKPIKNFHSPKKEKIDYCCGMPCKKLKCKHKLCKICFADQLRNIFYEFVKRILEKDLNWLNQQNFKIKCIDNNCYNQLFLSFYDEIVINVATQVFYHFGVNTKFFENISLLFEGFEGIFKCCPQCQFIFVEFGLNTCFWCFYSQI